MAASKMPAPATVERTAEKKVRWAREAGVAPRSAPHTSPPSAQKATDAIPSRSRSSDVSSSTSAGGSGGGGGRREGRGKEERRGGGDDGGGGERAGEGGRFGPRQASGRGEERGQGQAQAERRGDRRHVRARGDEDRAEPAPQHKQRKGQRIEGRDGGNGRCDDRQRAR
mmetsp:Transcript_15722/g.49987  ORF Transcript_15722/g.49987 Transcript_15722/m.49987 type:complete len:169 (-) Transcript_15722:2504-3010(-)